jgi:hypothetical protein
MLKNHPGCAFFLLGDQCYDCYNYNTINFPVKDYQITIFEKWVSRGSMIFLLLLTGQLAINQGSLHAFNSLHGGDQDEENSSLSSGGVFQFNGDDRPALGGFPARCRRFVAGFQIART